MCEDGNRCLTSLILLAISLLGPFSHAHGQEVPKIQWTQKQLYYEGYKAFLDEDYVTSLKDLFAFYVVNAERLAKPVSPEEMEFARTLKAAIDRSEVSVRGAVISQRQSQSHVMGANENHSPGPVRKLPGD
jgi:hypothetical protein